MIGRQLAHCERNEIRGAYNRAECLPERRRLMQAWADMLMHTEPMNDLTDIRARLTMLTHHRGPGAVPRAPER